MSMASIRRYYGVPAKRGMRVVMDGRPGVIVAASRASMHLRVRFDDAPNRISSVHPTWETTYDYGSGDSDLARWDQ